jgi:hypothetical protein
MPAERSRGSRVKSPSSRNKITDRKKYSSEKARRVAGLFLWRRHIARPISVQNSCGPGFSAMERFRMQQGGLMKPMMATTVLDASY